MNEKCGTTRIGCRQCVNAGKDWNDNSRESLLEIAGYNWITIDPEELSPLWARNSCMHFGPAETAFSSRCPQSSATNTPGED